MVHFCLNSSGVCFQLENIFSVCEFSIMISEQLCKYRAVIFLNFIFGYSKFGYLLKRNIFGFGFFFHFPLLSLFEWFRETTRERHPAELLHNLKKMICPCLDRRRLITKALPGKYSGAFLNISQG